MTDTTAMPDTPDAHDDDEDSVQRDIAESLELLWSPPEADEDDATIAADFAQALATASGEHPTVKDPSDPEPDQPAANPFLEVPPEMQSEDETEATDAAEPEPEVVEDDVPAVRLTLDPKVVFDAEAIKAVEAAEAVAWIKDLAADLADETPDEWTLSGETEAVVVEPDAAEPAAGAEPEAIADDVLGEPLGPPRTGENGELSEPAPTPEPAAESTPEAERAPEPQAEAGPEPEPQAEGQTLWHGRFAGGPAEELLAFTVSLPFDQRLAADDLAGSQAHIAGLAHVGLLTVEEEAAISVALDEVGRELAGGTFAFAPSDEDIHTAIERRVTELIGDVGGKLHSGRSRNDQVATTLRLWCKRELAAIVDRVGSLQQVLLDRSREAGPAYLPGYTHLQRAQPVLLAHHLLAHGWALARDVDRLRDCLARLDVSPLGAGALAGSSLPLDPAYTAERLGFSRAFANSLDAVSDRDFVAEALFALSLLAVHLSRMGEEIVLWTTEEFGFARLDDAYATGSSMLPQKKNADIAELVRGKAGRVIGDLTGLLATLKGLPLAYNRDLQEDKEPLFDAVDQVGLALGALSGLYRTLTFNTERMQTAADSPYMVATDLAEWLVEHGMPFRKAHAVVGGLVREALSGTGSLADLVAIHADLGPDAAALVSQGVPVERRTTPGGGGPEPVAAQLEAFAQHLVSTWGDQGEAPAGGPPAEEADTEDADTD